MYGHRFAYPARVPFGFGVGLVPTPAPAPPRPAPAPTAPALVLDGFAFDSDALTLAHAPLVLTFATNVVASQRTATPVIVIQLIGHTDSRGTEAYNVGLGQRRAERVRAALAAHMNSAMPGLASRISWSVTSAGETRPVSPTDQARNRRVEIVVTRRLAPAPPPRPGPTPSTPRPPAPRPVDPRCPRGKFLRSGIWTGDSSLSVSGGQAMRFFLKNRNVLGTTIQITADGGETHSLVLLPMGSAVMTFSRFGCEPMGWNFEISTNSDVFFVEWTLCSTWVPGDPRNC